MGMEKFGYKFSGMYIKKIGWKDKVVRNKQNVLIIF